jgi:DNA-binding TFAR19-related protein (PDSD5 family)
MGYQAKKTEHTGAKHGNGAYWGPKQDAKKESNTVRRRDEKRVLREQLTEGARQRAARDRLFVEELHEFADSQLDS